MAGLPDTRDVQINRTGFGFVYFLTDGEAIKIGFAVDVEKRIRELQVAHHVILRLLGAVAGHRRLERQIHSRLDHLNIRGEWFVIHDDVWDVLLKLEDDPGYVDGDTDAEYQKRCLRDQA